MDFRTVIEPLKPAFGISHQADSIFMLGSCFTDNIGTKLSERGFNVCHNPMGPLYNPASIERIISLALSGHTYTEADLVADESGVYHCLDFPLKFASPDKDKLLQEINSQFSLMAAALNQASVVIITLGTSRVFEFIQSSLVVGNCHKFPASRFKESNLSVQQAANSLHSIAKMLNGKHIIFTISPIRHGGSLHQNQLSKSTLLIAANEVCSSHPFVEYFPAYEIMLDDLRDYRFYASDMKHPSDLAVDYIYKIFSQTYFNPQTISRAEDCYKEYLRSAHRPNPTL